jgi:hypothetical protein
MATRSPSGEPGPGERAEEPARRVLPDPGGTEGDDGTIRPTPGQAERNRSDDPPA